MTKLLLLAAAATVMLSALASAEDSGQKPLSNCHPPSNGAPAWNSQPIENSAILPSTGGDTTSASPTVQRHGLPVEARNDCPPESTDPKARKPTG